MEMEQMTEDEIRIVKSAIGFGGIDNRTFANNLQRRGRLTSVEATNLFQKALNARVILEYRGYVRMAVQQDPRALSEAEIRELRAAGYSVHPIYDGSPSLYAWICKSGASQSHLKDRQPYRRTQAQAWVDCRNYYRGAVPSTPEADWIIGG